MDLTAISRQKIFYPPEWLEQSCVWFTYPHNATEWNAHRYESGSGLEAISNFYHRLIDTVLDFQKVNLVFPNIEMLATHKERLDDIACGKRFSLETFVIPNNDIWIRDYGPFFVYNSQGKKIVLDFAFNAWGGKFPPWDLDDELPRYISETFAYQYRMHSMILEGGSLEFNGDDLVLTTEQCLLNTNRNPLMSRADIEAVLRDEFCVEHVLWLKRGLEGDHTDGHIDDFARFIAPDEILICETQDTGDPNYEHLRESIEYLKTWRHPKTSQAFQVITIPLPERMVLDGKNEPLPCSYANFIFVNNALIVPIFKSKYDEIALSILQKALPERKVIGIDARVLIQGGGGIHCMSKQEPN